MISWMSFAIKQAAGTTGELALLSGYFMTAWVKSGAFTQINEPLKKNPKWDPSAVFILRMSSGLSTGTGCPSPHLDPVSPDRCGGLPYQGNVNAYSYNFDIMDSAGIDFPSEGSWGLETEYLDALTKATDPED